MSTDKKSPISVTTPNKYDAIPTVFPKPRIYTYYLFIYLFIYLYLYFPVLGFEANFRCSVFKDLGSFSAVPAFRDSGFWDRPSIFEMSLSISMMQSQQFTLKQKFKDFSSSFP